MDEYELIHHLSSKLENFTRVSKEKFQFRCPVCGDGKEGHKKKRGALININGSFVFKCLNCDDARPLGSLAKFVDYDLYREFRVSTFKNEDVFDQNQFKEETSEVSSPENLFKDFQKIEDLDSDHPAIKYLKGRKIPRSKISGIYYSDDFNKIAKKYSDNVKSDRVATAIVFPLITKDGIEFGFQARYLEPDKIRYKSIMIDRRFTKCFGQHIISENEDINVTEGVIDCLFFKNGIASLDGSLHSTCKKLPFDKSRFVLWFDNEPYNEQIMKIKSDAIEDGYRVAFYNDKVKHLGKDINEILMNSFNKKTYNLLIKESKIEKGLKAKILHSEETR